MSDIEQQLTDHLRRRAAAAVPRYDLEGVERGTVLVQPVELERDVPAARRDRKQQPRRLVLGVAAAATLVAIAVAAVEWNASDDVDVATPPGTAREPLGDGWFAFAGGPGGPDIYLVREGGEPRRVELPGSDAYSEICPAFAPGPEESDRQRLMVGRAVGSDDAGYNDAELMIVDVAEDASVSSPLTIPVEGLEEPPCAIWSPDGRWAAFGGADGLWVVDTSSGDVRELTDHHPTDLEWRPGTDQLAITGHQPGRKDDAELTPVLIHTASTGDTRELGAVLANQLTWSPDGATLAFTANVGNFNGPDEGIWLADADGTNVRQLVERTGVVFHGTGVAWSPAGDVIAYQRRNEDCCERHEVVLVTATGDDPANPLGTETVIPPPQTETSTGSTEWYPYNVTWSPDGTRLIYAAWGDPDAGGLIAVPVAPAGSPTLLIEGFDIRTRAHTTLWIPLQPWS